MSVDSHAEQAALSSAVSHTSGLQTAKDFQGTLLKWGAASLAASQMLRATSAAHTASLQRVVVHLTAWFSAARMCAPVQEEAGYTVADLLRCPALQHRPCVAPEPPSPVHSHASSPLAPPCPRRRASLARS